MWVIKIGGSLGRAPELRSWLRALEALQRSGQAWVIVPGGGEFAEQVRLAQAQWHFDDSIAHRMALLAMAQYAWLLHGLAPSLICRAALDDLERAANARQCSIWLTTEPGPGTDELPHDWDVTSDTLSLWLARELRADGLVLVKSAAPQTLSTSAAALSASGYLDVSFPALREQTGCRVWWLEKSQYALLDRAARGELPLSQEIL